jgi:hypothetical protein
MPEIVIAGMIGWLGGLSLAMWEHRKQHGRLQEIVGELVNDRTRAITWAQLIDELELRVCDVQVSGISDALQKLAEEQK